MPYIKIKKIFVHEKKKTADKRQFSFLGYKERSLELHPVSKITGRINSV